MIVKISHEIYYEIIFCWWEENNNAMPSTGEDNVAPSAKENIVISEIKRAQRAGFPRKNMVDMIKLLKKNA